MIGRAPLRTALGALALAAALAVGCEDVSGEREEAVPDARLLTHAVSPGTPTAAGLRYLESIAEVHRRADATADPGQAVEILRGGLSLAPPSGLSESEALRLELAARLGETLLPARAREARELLTDMLPTDRSLPIDRASAHALVVLGDAALAEGDDAHAAGSYARAIRMMSLLRQELRP